MGGQSAKMVWTGLEKLVLVSHGIWQNICNNRLFSL